MATVADILKGHITLDKDDIANELCKKDSRRDVVIFVVIAQEKQQVFKGKKKVEKGHINFSFS